MMLYIRMALYALFAGLAGAAIGDFEAATGTYTITVDQLLEIIGPIVGFIATFIASRVAKKRGGAT